MNILDNVNAKKVVVESVLKEARENEKKLKEFQSALYDLYDGGAKKVVENHIDRMFGNFSDNQDIKKLMKTYLFTPNLLKHFIDMVARNYNKPPNRKFYLNKKLVVKELPKNVSDEFLSDYEVNEDLYNILHDRIYTDELNLKLKQIEKLTNLFSQTICIMNKDGANFNIDFLNPWDTKIEVNEQNTTRAMEISYFVGSSNQKYSQTSAKVNRYTTPNKQNKEMIEKELKQNKIDKDSSLPLIIRSENNELTYVAINEYAIKYVEMMKQKYPDEPCYTGNYDETAQLESWELNYNISNVFPPFVIFKNKLSLTHFIEPDNEDLMYNIIQLYIQFSNLCLAMIKNISPIIVTHGMDKDTVFSNMPGATNNFMQLHINSSELKGVSSVQPDAKAIDINSNMKDVMECIAFLSKTLSFVTIGDNFDLISSGTKQSAESKAIDSEKLKQKIDDNRQFAHVNESNLFKSIKVFWNTHYPNNPLPNELEMTVDFKESKDISKELEMFQLDLLKLAENMTNIPDLIQKYNPDLTTQEATTEFELNKKLNEQTTDVFESGHDDVLDDELIKSE